VGDFDGPRVRHRAAGFNQFYARVAGLPPGVIPWMCMYPGCRRGPEAVCCTRFANCKKKEKICAEKGLFQGSGIMRKASAFR